MYKGSVSKKKKDMKDDLLAHEKYMRHEEEAHHLHGNNVEVRKIYAN